MLTLEAALNSFNNLHCGQIYLTRQFLKRGLSLDLYQHEQQKISH
jgi:hypothetical protein